MDNIITVKNLTFEYFADSEQASLKAIDDISFEIERGSFVAVLGKNGSGKSTLAKNFNGLLVPTDGVVIVDGYDTANMETLWDVRQSAGMVFQNPDNQLVSAIVEDDVAFGPENLGVEPSEIRRRVDKALADVNMGKFRKKAPHLLSGGQKQRIAIAGVVAMKPKCIIFDEPTAMLDPRGRDEIMSIIDELHAEGITVILITHFMEEAVRADRVIIMHEGRILLDGTPQDVFENEEMVRSANLEVPLMADIAAKLRARGIDVPKDIITEEKMVEFICQYK